PPKSPDPKLERFFDAWVYGTGVPALKMTYAVRGKAPALRVTGTVTQTEADPEFVTEAPVEVQIARGRSVIQWVRTSAEPAPFTIPVRQLPLKVTLDPGMAVLSKRN